MAHPTPNPPARRTDVRPGRRRQPNTHFARLAWIAGWSLLLTILVVFASAWVLYQSAQRMPDFYRVAINQTPQKMLAAGAELERNLARLHNQVARGGRWRSTFTEDQINGWLQFDLPAKFPASLPSSISEPRIALAKGELQLAFRVHAKQLSGIVVASADLFCTHEKNQIGIRIKSVSSGLLPIKIDRWANQITSKLRAQNVAVSWSEMDGDPVALITVPSLFLESQQVEIEAIGVLDQKIELIGETFDPGHFDPGHPLQQKVDQPESPLEGSSQR